MTDHMGAAAPLAPVGKKGEPGTKVDIYDNGIKIGSAQVGANFTTLVQAWKRRKA